MLNPMQLLNMLLQRNPQVSQNPRNQEFLKVLQSGDQTQIENLANTICNNYGVTKEQVMQQVPMFQQQFGMGPMNPNGGNR